MIKKPVLCFNKNLKGYIELHVLDNLTLFQSKIYICLYLLSTAQSRILLAYTPKTKLFWRKTMKMPYYGISPLNYEQELKRYKLSAFSNMYVFN